MFSSDGYAFPETFYLGKWTNHASLLPRYSVDKFCSADASVYGLLAVNYHISQFDTHLYFRYRELNNL